MKKILAVLLLLCTVLAFVACANKDQTPDGMKDVAIEGADYHLYVPEAWIPTNTAGLSGAHAGGGDKPFSPNVIVTVYYPDGVTTLAAYFKDVVKPELDLTFAELVPVENEKAVTMGGKDALLYTYTYTLGGTAYKQMQVIVGNGSCIYTLAYTATANLYDTYIEEVNRIIAEFTFK
ncbi:MAG: hypothetical protein IJC99_03695 [Clostridia bacterium]|nr:hypothetical protein [Clostridia bacterium]